MSLISNVQAYTYTDKISALTLAPTPYNSGDINYYNVLYIGTSNGRIYLFNESEQTIQSIVPTGYFGTLSGEITGMTVDPNGKFLFVNAPYDKHCLRINLANIPITSTTQSLSVPVDRDIYTFGDNTGNIVVSTTGVVYLVTGNGVSISVMEQYGNSFINLFFLQTAPALNFKGIALSPNEQRIYANDSRLGDTHYYDFLSNQPTFNILNAYGTTTNLGDVVTSGNNIFYTRVDGVYSKNTLLNTTLRVAGNGKTTYVPTTDPQQFTLIGTNAVTAASNGDIFLSSSNVLGQSQLYKVSFSLVERNGYQPPLPRQEIPILQPYPTTSCKRIVEPFNPRLRFGWGLTNTKRPPILDVVKHPLCCPPPVVNCPVTPFYCLPTPPPVFPPQPVAPVYPTTSSMKQFMDHTLTIGSRSSIAVDSKVLLSTSLTFSSVRSLVPPAFGPLGEIYFASENGNLTKIYNGGISWTKSIGGTFVYASPVVSSTGAVTVVTDLGLLYRLDSNASVIQFFPITLGQQVGGAPACVTNTAYDYIIAAYGNKIGAFSASNACNIWTGTTQLPGELYRTSVVSDGVNVFAGTNASRVYCYVAETGVLNWLYTIPTGGTPLTPSITENNIGIVSQYDSNIYILSNTTVRSQAYDIRISLSGTSIISPPVLSTDPAGNLWAHVITSAGNIYGIGGIFNNTSSGNSYRYIWSNSTNTIIPSIYSNLLPVIDSAGIVYVPSTYGTLDPYQAYFTASTTQVIQPNLSSLVLNQTSTVNNPPIQISLTPLMNSKNTMYVFSRQGTTNTNYMYTISG